MVGRSRRGRLFALLSLVGFGLFWTYLGLPLIQTPEFGTLSPLVAYPVYNLGWILTFSGGLAFILHLAARKTFHLSRSLSAGLGSWLGASFFYDVLQPGFYLSPTGQVLIPLGSQTGENTAVDAFVATIWSILFPSVVGTPLWYNLTYRLVPIVSVIIMFISWFPGLLRRRRRK